VAASVDTAVAVAFADAALEVGQPVHRAAVAAAASPYAAAAVGHAGAVRHAAVGVDQRAEATNPTAVIFDTARDIVPAARMGPAVGISTWLPATVGRAGAPVVSDSRFAPAEPYFASATVCGTDI